MKVGSLVECIVAVHPIVRMQYFFITFPEKGKIYTVREIQNHDGGRIGICLEEIKNPELNHSEFCFDINAFREVLPAIQNIEEYINENTAEPVLVEQ
jgi:hypothetical protein